MKKCINPKQRDELNKNQKDVLWNKGFKNPYMTIGEMIEFLGDDFQNINYSKINNWCVSLNNYPQLFFNKELCDALWEAVKYILIK